MKNSIATVLVLLVSNLAIAAGNFEISKEVHLADVLAFDSAQLVEVDCKSLCQEGERLMKLTITKVFTNSCRISQNIVIAGGDLEAAHVEYMVLNADNKRNCPANYKPISKTYTIAFVKQSQRYPKIVNVNGVVVRQP